MSRGGTTWIGNCLNEHPNVAVFGESLFWGRNYIVPTGEEGCYTKGEVKRVLSLLAQSCVAFLNENSGQLKNIKKTQWHDIINTIDVVECTPAELFRKVCLKISDEEKVEYVIEKTPHHLNWIPRIVEAYPGTKLVVMVREAYGFMLSYKHQGDRKSKEVKAQFKALYHPIACAFIWRRYMLSALEMRTRFPKQTHVVEFDDLRNKSEVCWQNVLSFWGIEYAPLIKVEGRNSSFVANRKTLSPVDVFWMNLVAGRVMRRGGYVKKKSSAGLGAISFSVLQLIPWSCRAVFLLKSRVPGGMIKYFLRIIK